LKRGALEEKGVVNGSPPPFFMGEGRVVNRSPLQEPCLQNGHVSLPSGFGGLARTSIMSGDRGACGKSAVTKDRKGGW